MKTLSALAIFSFIPTLGLHAAEPLVWNIEAAGKGPAVSPMMHGIFFEDINYAADGGLYAELVTFHGAAPPIESRAAGSET